MSDSLEIVYCSVDIALGGNNILFDREKISTLFTQQLTEYLKKYGVKYEIEPLRGLGGGGGGSVTAVLYQLWQQHWILGYIIASIRFLFNHYSTVASSKIFYKYDDSKPRMQIFLRLKSEEKIDDQSLETTEG